MQPVAEEEPSDTYGASEVLTAGSTALLGQIFLDPADATAPTSGHLIPPVVRMLPGRLAALGPYRIRDQTLIVRSGAPTLFVGTAHIAPGAGFLFALQPPPVCSLDDAPVIWLDALRVL